MSDEMETQVRDLIARAKEMTEGPAKRAVFYEAIDTADLHQHDLLGFDSRMASLWSTYENGDIRLLFVHFAWCLAASDRNPDWDRYSLLWRYRWVIDSMPYTPEISRDQILSALDDMTRRYAAAGYSPRPVHVLARRVHRNMGEKEKEIESFEKIKDYPRDNMSDGYSTEASFAIHHHIFHKRYAQCVKMAEALLDKLPANDHYSGSTRADMLLPLLHLGDPEKAGRYHRSGVRINGTLHRNYSCFRHHIRYLAIIGDLSASVDLAEKHFPTAFADHSPLSRLEFYQVLQFVCERLVKAGGAQSMKSPALPCAKDGRVAISDLQAFLETEMVSIADRLDERNGNSWYRRALVDERAEWNALADRLASGAMPSQSSEKNNSMRK